MLLLGILATTEMPEGDIRYYFSSLRGEFPDGLTEYPAVGTWPAHVVFWFSHRSTEHYLAMFGGFCMVIDALFFVLLLNSGAARSWLPGFGRCSRCAPGTFRCNDSTWFPQCWWG